MQTIEAAQAAGGSYANVVSAYRAAREQGRERDFPVLPVIFAIARMKEEGMHNTCIAEAFGQKVTWVAHRVVVSGLHPGVLALMDHSRPEEERLSMSDAFTLRTAPRDSQPERAKRLVLVKTRRIAASRRNKKNLEERRKNRTPR